MAQKTERIAYLYVSITVLFWGASAVIVKLLLHSLNNIQIILFVSLFATISLFIAVLLQDKIKVIKKYTRKDYWNLIWISFIGPFLYYVLFYGGLGLSSAQEAIIILYTWPLWAVVLAIPILKEHFSLRKLSAIVLGFIGVCIVATNGTFVGFLGQHIMGDLLVLTGAFCWGLFSILGKKYDYERVTSMLFYFLFTFIFTLITVLLFSSIPQLTSYQLLGLLAVGIFNSVGSVCWFLALKHGETGSMSNIVLLTPFASLIWIVILLNEAILLSSFIGLILIVSGIILQTLKRKSK